jgi:hypothetical protein
LKLLQSIHDRTSDAVVVARLDSTFAVAEYAGSLPIVRLCLTPWAFRGVVTAREVFGMRQADIVVLPPYAINVKSENWSRFLSIRELSLTMSPSLSRLRPLRVVLLNYVGDKLPIIAAKRDRLRQLTSLVNTKKDILVWWRFHCSFASGVGPHAPS